MHIHGNSLPLLAEMEFLMVVIPIELISDSGDHILRFSNYLYEPKNHKI
jgi:hypothetical protein